MKKKLILPQLANKSSKSLKDSVHVQYGPLDLILPVLREGNNSPNLASKTTKSLKSQVQNLNALFALIHPVCEKNLFLQNLPEDSDKQKQPCSGAEWPIRLVWPSLWERGNSPHLVRKTPKGPKSRVRVQNGPFDLIRLVCETD